MSALYSAACSNLPLKPLDRGILSPIVDPLLVKRGSQAAYGLCLGAHRRRGCGSRRQPPVPGSYQSPASGANPGTGYSAVFSLMVMPNRRARPPRHSSRIS